MLSLLLFDIYIKRNDNNNNNNSYSNNSIIIITNNNISITIPIIRLTNF